MKELISNMFILQDKLNTIIDNDWKQKRTSNDWRIAIFVEAGELIESLDWKWWKKQEVDLDNVKMEIVDIWHFGISAVLNSNDKYWKEDLEVYIFRYDKEKFKDLDNKSKINYLITEITYLCNYLHYCQLDNIPMSASYMLDRLFKISELFELDFEKDIYLTYIVKNILNIFRQEHGYKQGKYIKNWNGKEDNQIVQELLESYLKDNISLADIPDRLLTDLERIYQNLTN